MARILISQSLIKFWRFYPAKFLENKYFLSLLLLFVTGSCPFVFFNFSLSRQTFQARIKLDRKIPEILNLDNL